VAAALLLLASWWLLNTMSIRVFVGESIGALCLGVIAVSILQGMHLPLAIWPDGPWRKQFATPAVLGTAFVIAALILISRVANVEPAVERIDLGNGIAVVIGTVGLGFGVAFVKQSKFFAWYAIALVLAVLPFLTSLALGDRTVPLCMFSVPVSETNCNAAVIPSLVFLTGVGVTFKLVTEELAFRRLLIGASSGAGIASILFSSLVACAWYLVLSRAGVEVAGGIVTGALGAVSAGCIYVLSKSLVTSAIFTAVYAAGNVSLAVANATADTTAAVAGDAWPAVIVSSVVALLLAAVVFRKHGFLGNLKEATSRHVISN
jgi:hypothetical protein